MVYCDRCDEEVKKLTKTTGTCPTCAKEEVEMGNYVFDIDGDPETESQAMASTIRVEMELGKEGYILDDIPDRGEIR